MTALATGYRLMNTSRIYGIAMSGGQYNKGEEVAIVLRHAIGRTCAWATL